MRLLDELEALYRASGFSVVSRESMRIVLRQDSRYVELREFRPLGRETVEVRRL